MMDNELYQYIFDEIMDCVNVSWNKLVIYLEYGEASYTFDFYVKNESGYTKCFDLPGVSDKELMETFRNIDKLVSSERDNLKDKWSNLTMVVTDDGSMKTDFDYTDLSDGTYQYHKNWKSKYLI